MIETEFREGGRWRRNPSTVGASAVLCRTARIRLYLFFFFFVFLVLALAQVLAAATANLQKRAPNVILITIDTVRADHLGCYGAKNVRTPTLDALGRDGVVFE